MGIIRDLKDIRVDINRIDEEMARLFAERMKLVEGVAKYKKSVGMKILDSNREKEMVKRNSDKVKDETLKKYYIDFLESNIKISRNYQSEILNLDNKPNKVGYQGIEGSFSNIALKSKYPDVETRAYKNFEDVFIGIEKNEIEKGILPIENSYTGDITDNFDLIKKHKLYITDIIKLKIDHNLLGIKGSKISEIKEVYSHIQGFKQSRKFLQGRGYKEIPYYNTAISAKFVSESKDITKAAIGSAKTADIYNLEILAKNINTHDGNTTKFIEISSKLKVEENHNRIMVVFSTYNKSGDLSSVLGEFTKYNINMLSIKSRPLKEAPWEYMFFVELEGNYRKLKDSIEKLSEKSKYFEVIGSYEN